MILRFIGGGEKGEGEEGGVSSFDILEMSTNKVIRDSLIKMYSILTPEVPPFLVDNKIIFPGSSYIFLLLLFLLLQLEKTNRCRRNRNLCLTLLLPLLNLVINLLITTYCSVVIMPF